MGFFTKGNAPTGTDLGSLGTGSLGSLPAELQSAIINTQGVAAQQMNWARLAYLQNLGVTGDVVDNFLQSSATNHQLAANAGQRYEGQFQPLEDQLIRESQDYASPERKATNMGAAQAQVAQNMEAQRHNAETSLESYGINPSDVRFSGLDAGLRAQQGAAEAAAATQAGLQTDALGRALRSEALNIGQRYPGNITAFENAGNQGLTGAENATLAQTASGANTMGTPQTWQQIADQLALGSGQLQNQANANQINAAKVNQTASSGIGGLIGAGGALAKSLFADGGPVGEDFGWGGMGEGFGVRRSAIPDAPVVGATSMDPSNGPDTYPIPDPAPAPTPLKPTTPQFGGTSPPPASNSDPTFGHNHVGGQQSYSAIVQFIQQLLGSFGPQSWSPGTGGAPLLAGGGAGGSGSTTNSDPYPIPSRAGDGFFDPAMRSGVTRGVTPISISGGYDNNQTGAGVPGIGQVGPNPGWGVSDWSGGAGYGGGVQNLNLGPPSGGAIPTYTPPPGAARGPGGPTSQRGVTALADGGPVIPVEQAYAGGAMGYGNPGYGNSPVPLVSTFDYGRSNHTPDQDVTVQRIGNRNEAVFRPHNRRASPLVREWVQFHPGKIPAGWSNYGGGPNWGTGALPYDLPPGYMANNNTNVGVTPQWATPQMASGGAVPGATPGGTVPPQASPTQGAIPDDVPAQLTVDEFVIPKDVAVFKGHEFFQNLIQKTRQARAGAPAKPQQGVAPAQKPTFASRPGAIPLR